jgi:hypothetical protein
MLTPSQTKDRFKQLRDRREKRIQEERNTQAAALLTAIMIVGLALPESSRKMGKWYKFKE